MQTVTQNHGYTRTWGWNVPLMPLIGRFFTNKYSSHFAYIQRVCKLTNVSSSCYVTFTPLVRIIIIPVYINRPYPCRICIGWIPHCYFSYCEGIIIYSALRLSPIDLFHCLSAVARRWTLPNESRYVHVRGCKSNLPDSGRVQNAGPDWDRVIPSVTSTQPT